MGPAIGTHNGAPPSRRVWHATPLRMWSTTGTANRLHTVCACSTTSLQILNPGPALPVPGPRAWVCVGGLLGPVPVCAGLAPPPLPHPHHPADGSAGSTPSAAATPFTSVPSDDRAALLHPTGPLPPAIGVPPLLSHARHRSQLGPGRAPYHTCCGVGGRVGGRVCPPLAESVPAGCGGILCP